MSKFYSVILRSSVLAQQFINRWTYHVAGATPSSSANELLTLMGFLPALPHPSGADETIFGALIAIQSFALQYVEVQCEELYTPTDFYTAAYSPSFLGGVEDQVFSITDAYGLFSTRVRTDIKRGFKRFGGVPSTAYVGGSQIGAGYDVNLGVLAERMSIPLEGATETYDPSIFQFEEYTTPHGNRAYRKYATAAEQDDHVAVDVEWAAYNTVRTQVSRQLGRGV